MTLRLKLLSAALALSLAACGSGTVEVPMKALNDTGQDGKATLTQQGDDVRVVLDIKVGADTGDQTAHIHEGNCPGLGGILYGLNALKTGQSTTLIENIKLEDVAKKAINVHNSQTPTKYVSCGEIP